MKRTSLPLQRREFITAARRRGGRWPLAARAQQASGCGASACLLAELPTMRKFRRASRHSCRGFRNWVDDGRNMRSTSLGDGQCRRIAQASAAELVALAPDVILPHGAAPVAALQQATRPCRSCSQRRRSGRRRLRRQPGAARRQRHRLHAVRIRHERQMAGAAQRNRAHVTRVAVLRALTRDQAGTGQFAAIQAVAPSLGIEVSPIERCATQRDRARHRGVRASPNGGSDCDGTHGRCVIAN